MCQHSSAKRCERFKQQVEMPLGIGRRRGVFEDGGWQACVSYVGLLRMCRDDEKRVGERLVVGPGNDHKSDLSILVCSIFLEIPQYVLCSCIPTLKLVPALIAIYSFNLLLLCGP